MTEDPFTFVRIIDTLLRLRLSAAVVDRLTFDGTIIGTRAGYWRLALAQRQQSAADTISQRHDQPQTRPAVNARTAIPGRQPESGAFLDRRDKLGDGRNTCESRVSPIHAAGQIGGAPIRGEQVDTIKKNCRRTREWDRCRRGTVGQQTIRHLDVAAIEFGEGCFNPRPCLDPVRALIDVKDFYAHTPVSLSPCPSRVWLESPTWGRVTLTQPERGAIGRSCYPGATKPSVGDGLAALHTLGPGSPRDERTEMKTRSGVRAASTVAAVPVVTMFALGTTRLHHQEM